MPDDLLESQVRDQLHRALGEGPSTSPDWAELSRRLGPARRRRRQRHLATVVAAVAVLALSAAWAIQARDGGERVRTVPLGPSPSSSVTTSRPSGPAVTTATPSSRPTLPVRVLGHATVVGARGVMVAGTDASLWVAVVDQGQVTHVGPTGQILATVALPPGRGSAVSGPGQLQAKSYPIWLASGEGAIWALSFGTGTLYRIDPATNRITASVDVAGSQQQPRTEVERVAAGLGHVWVTVCCDADAPNQRLLRIDPNTLAVDPLRADLPGDGESETPVAGTPGLFVTGEGFDTVAQVDPTTMKVLRLISVPGGAGPVSLGSAAFVVGGWSTATSTGDHVYRLDPVTHQAVAFAALPVPVQVVAATSAPELWGLAIRGGSAGISSVIRFSATSASVLPSSTSASGIAAAPDGTLWYEVSGTVVRVRATGG